MDAPAIGWSQYLITMFALGAGIAVVLLLVLCLVLAFNAIRRRLRPPGRPLPPTGGNPRVN